MYHISSHFLSLICFQQHLYHCIWYLPSLQSASLNPLSSIPTFSHVVRSDKIIITIIIMMIVMMMIVTMMSVIMMMMMIMMIVILMSVIGIISMIIFRLLLCCCFCYSYVCLYCINLGTICLSILKDEPGGWSPGITIKQLLTGE